MGAYENILQYFNWSQTLTRQSYYFKKKTTKKNRVNRKTTQIFLFMWVAKAEIWRE